ncbi:MAG: CoB--CoM heterodisulfide reductase iron-sulfur subunit A family protein [Thermoplasmata archaeon]
MTNKKIGVYICHCGGNISDYVDVKKVKESIEHEPGVLVAKTVMFACSDSTQQEMIQDIKEKGLDAIVVASCSPKLHELTFRGVANRAGLNQFKYVHANIREQVSWAHSDNPNGATEKAIGTVKGAIAKVADTVPLKTVVVEAVQSVLIVGGGISGMKAALQYSDMGINSFLIEKSPFLGGRISQWSSTFPTGKKGKDIALELFEELKKRANITIFTNAELVGRSGSMGNFNVKIKISPRYVKKPFQQVNEAIEKCPVEIEDEFNFGLTKKKAIYKPFEGVFPDIPAIDTKACTKCGICAKLAGDAIDLNEKEQVLSLNVGAILVASGFDPYTPKEGEYGYKKSPFVVTLPQLERILELNKGDKLVYNGKEIKTMAFIYCVGSRQKKTDENQEVNTYCSRYCCSSTVFTSASMMKKYPYLKMYHMYRDIRTYGKNEPFYEEASRSGVVFMKYNENEPPQVTIENGMPNVTVKDMLTDNEILEISPDMLVLVVGMVPRENSVLDNVLKISKGRDRFYNEVHIKLKPVETVIGGIYLAGASQGPKNSVEAVASSLAAVSKASPMLFSGKVELEPLVAKIDPVKCTMCGKCFEACPYDAIQKGNVNGKEVATVVEVICKGCGACVPSCPEDAIDVSGYTDTQMTDMISAILKNGGVAHE